jgi:hypothetical protein
LNEINLNKIKGENMKKLSIVLIAVILVLTGCSTNALLVANSFKKTMDLSSYESKTSISLSGNLSGVPMDDKSKRVMDILKDGIVIDTVQKNAQESHATISLNNPDLILGSELWPSKTAPSFDLFLNTNDLYVKSSIDKKFLALSSEATNVPDSMTSDKMKPLLTAFVNQYDYNLKHLEKVDQERVTFPNGSALDTTHLRISLDMKEALDMAAYTIENLSRFDGLKELPSLLSNTGETQKEIDLTEIKNNLSDMVQQIKSWKVEDLQAAGYDAKLVINLWIDKDNQIVQNETNINFKLPSNFAEQSNSSDQADLNLTVWNQSWNHNKNLTIQYPSEGNIVSVEKIKKDIKLLNSFDKSSPNRFLAKMELLMQAEPFVDVPSYDWAYEPVTMLHQMDIISGYENNEFKPESNITRAEFITMAANTMGLKPVAANVSFNDKNQIPDWANKSVQAAFEAGLIDGYEDGSLRPNQPISRAEIVAILVKGFHLPIVTDYSLKYSDQNEIPNWAENYVKTAVSDGLVDGYEDGSFAPNNQAKRSEVASILYKAIMKID